MTGSNSAHSDLCSSGLFHRVYLPGILPILKGVNIGHVTVDHSVRRHTTRAAGEQRRGGWVSLGYDGQEVDGERVLLIGLVNVPPPLRCCGRIVLSRAWPVVAGAESGERAA